MDLELRTDRRAIHEIQMVAHEELVLTIPRHLTSSYSAVELFSLDGGGILYFRWDLVRHATIRNPMCDVFPAAIGSIMLPVPGYGNTGQVPAMLRVISEGTPLLSIIRR